MKNTSFKNLLSRQEFLGVSLVGALTILFGQSTAALLRFLKPVSSSGFGGLVYAGKVDEFPVGSVSHILTGRFYITRTEDGLIALWQKCTHLGCAIPWEETEGQFHCPCHGSLFDPLGTVTGGPAPRPMDTFPVIIKNGEVWVDTSQPTERTQYDVSQMTGV